jgi:hypothetical protein
VRQQARDAALVALGAFVLRIPAFLSPQQLGFDDGVFGQSVLAMRAGGVPYRDVFSSQGPLFLPLAWLGDLVTGRTINSPRAIAVLSGVVLAVAVYCAGRAITTRSGALLAAALVAISGSVLWTTGPLTSDGPGEALATSCVAVALAYRRHPSVGKVVAIGLLAGAAFSVKSLLAIPALIAAGLIVVDRRQRRDIIAVPAIAAALIFLVAVPWGLSRVYEQSVTYHTDQAHEREIPHNAVKTARALFERDLPLIVASAGALIVAVFALRRRPRNDERHRPGVLSRFTAGAGPIIVWLLLSLAVLLLEAPMWRNHLSHVIPAAALLIGVVACTPRVATAIADAVLVVMPWHVANLSELLWPRDYSGERATIVDAIRRLPAGAQVISDDPGLAWRAGHRAPDQFVDVSVLRIHSRRRRLQIDVDDVVRGARRPEVCAVVRVSHLRFGSFRGLGPALEREGYRLTIGGPRRKPTMWVKRRCDPEVQASVRANGSIGGPFARPS